MDFRVLGPVEARAEGRPLALAGARQRALLAVLLLRAGEPVSRERVIADLWGEWPPAGAVKTVQRWCRGCDARSAARREDSHRISPLVTSPAWRGSSAMTHPDDRM